MHDRDRCTACGHPNLLEKPSGADEFVLPPLLSETINGTVYYYPDPSHYGCAFCACPAFREGGKLGDAKIL